MEEEGVSLQPEPPLQPLLSFPSSPPPWLTKKKVPSIWKILGPVHFYPLGHLVKRTSILS